MDFFDDSETSLEDIEPSFLENLDPFELEQLESEAINICSQNLSRSQNQTELQEQSQIKFEAGTQEQVYREHESHNYDQVYIQDMAHTDVIQKEICLVGVKNIHYNNVHVDSSKINEQNNIDRYNDIYQSNINFPYNISLWDKYEKVKSCSGVFKTEKAQTLETKIDISQDMIAELLSYTKRLELERDEFKEIAQAKSKELMTTQALLHKKQQFYTDSMNNLKKQYTLSLEKLVSAQKKTEDLNQILTENLFQKKELKETSQLIKQYEYLKKEKEIESNERIINSPMKRKRKLKKNTSSDSTTLEYEYIVKSPCLQDKENIELQILSEIVLQMNNAKKSKFIEELFDYRIDYIFTPDNSTVLDILSSYKLPESSISVSSMIIKSISNSLFTLDSVLNFLLYLIDYIIVIWKGCLKHNYDGPIRYIVSLIHFIIVFRSSIFHKLVDKIESLLTLLQNTIIRYATVTIKETKVFNCINKFIVQKCLEILNMIISLSQENEQIMYKISFFFEFNSILMMLNPLQDLLFIKRTLSFLSKCIFSKCVGHAGKNGNLIYNSDCFSKILDIVSKYLTEKYEKYEIYELMELKLEAIKFLNTILLGYVNGKDLLGFNVTVVSRLCRCLTELVRSHGISKISIQRINLIQSIVFILHEIISPDNLSLHFAQPWTQYAYIVSMTRLSFVEDEDHYGKDIFDDKTVELARDLLEMVVGPEEGDELYDLFHISS
ncbi:hypothetical protein PCK1_002887 [Pneumocystis canis]|nr:hypothetical protein PCK1_002887 [Pneumocystis canis]